MSIIMNHSTITVDIITHRRPYTAPQTHVECCELSHAFAASDYTGNGNGWIDDDDEELDFGVQKFDWPSNDNTRDYDNSSENNDVVTNIDMNPYRLDQGSI